MFIVSRASMPPGVAPLVQAVVLSNPFTSDSCFVPARSVGVAQATPPQNRITTVVISLEDGHGVAAVNRLAKGA
jgi:hypothetical protein